LVPAKHSQAARYAKGVSYGLLSGLFMAIATLMTKKGAADIPPVAATQIRIFCPSSALSFSRLSRKNR
jgi:uncharacterized membrane protein